MSEMMEEKDHLAGSKLSNVQEIDRAKDAIIIPLDHN